MQLTINIPDIFSNDKILQFISKLENFFLKEGIEIEIKSDLITNDSWDNLNIDAIAVDAGIEDFSENHDHYLYGIVK